MIKVSTTYSGHIQTNCHESGVDLGKCQMRVNWGQMRDFQHVI